MAATYCCLTLNDGFERNHTNCLKEIFKTDLLHRPFATYYACKYGNLELLKYVVEDLYFYWSPRTILMAAAVGNTECLKYAYENECDWDDSAFFAAASNNHLNTLKYIVEKAFRFTENDRKIFIDIMKHDSLSKRFSPEIKQYLTKIGC